MCTNCWTARPHVSRVKAIGNNPLLRVGIISIGFALLEYNASATGSAARIIGVLYREILETLLLFLNSCVIVKCGNPWIYIKGTKLFVSF